MPKKLEKEQVKPRVSRKENNTDESGNKWPRD